MDKVIYTDVDGTLLSFAQPWGDFLKENGYPDIDPSIMINHITICDLLKINKEREIEAVEAFFESGRAYDLPALPHAIEPVQRLYKDGWSFVALTACPDGDGVAEARKRNLERVFEIPFQVIISGSQCKGEYLDRFKPTVWVEDHFMNAQLGFNRGYRTFLIDRKHNRYPSNCERITDWREIEQKLCWGN